MKLFIEPNDVLMFRDGRPFAGGDDHFARGSFPPSPSTIYGALRSHILSVKSGEFDTFKNEPAKISKAITDEVGTKKTLGTLAIAQFGVAKNNEGQIQHYFPIPRDIAKEKGKEDGKLYILKPDSFINNIALTDMPLGLQHLWRATEEALEAASGFLSEDELASYLMGKAPEKIIEAKEIYQTEERTGIRKNRSIRSVETGGLYSVEYFRMKEGFGFALDAAGTKLLPESGILRLGGDHRSASYFKSSWNDIDTKHIKDKILRDKHFKLILLTPAVFSQGWLPESIDRNTFEGAINGVKLKMTSACVGKPIGIGGYDFVKNHPKVMNKAVPAGSVYYFELSEGDVDSLFKNVWLKSISDEKTQEGFGITLIGGY
ncbi:MAG: type III-B CRISPR module-associated protein Cmr3 [Nitrospinae bacterium]|nr:type III-B CRISPR module-associated protein Cmr3 [Nitrospinota bacterium]